MTRVKIVCIAELLYCINGLPYAGCNQTAGYNQSVPHGIGKFVVGLLKPHKILF